MHALARILVVVAGVAVVGACSSDGDFTPSYDNGPNRPLLAMIVFGVIAFVLIMVVATVFGRRFLKRRAQWRANLVVVDDLCARARQLAGARTDAVVGADQRDAREAAWDDTRRSADDIVSQTRELVGAMGDTEISDRLDGLATSLAALRGALQTYVDGHAADGDRRATSGAADTRSIAECRGDVETATQRLAEERTRLRRPKPTFDDQF